MSFSGLLAVNAPRSGYANGFHASDTAAVFAADIARRAAATQGLATPEQGASSLPENAAADQEKSARLQQLESALADTVAYMAEQHGEQAGAALMGIVYKRLGNGEVTEESLGNAFLDVTRFIDAAFGIAKGDAFLEHLNGDLNNSLNAFFDNGSNEVFFASNGVGGSISGLSTAGLNTEHLAESVNQLTESILRLVQEARNAGPDAAGPAGRALAAYAASAKTQPMLTGVLADTVI